MILRWIKGWVEDWVEDWIETWRILRNKELMASLKRAEEDMREGKYLTHKEAFDSEVKWDETAPKLHIYGWKNDLKRLIK